MDNDNKYYIKGVTDRFLKDLSMRIDYRPVYIINNAFYNFGHRFLYDEQLLIESLQNAGFSEVRRKIYGKSKAKVFNNVESHERGVGDVKICEIESLVFEGVKI